MSRSIDALQQAARQRHENAEKSVAAALREARKANAPITFTGLAAEAVSQPISSTAIPACARRPKPSGAYVPARTDKPPETSTSMPPKALSSEGFPKNSSNCGAGATDKSKLCSKHLPLHTANSSNYGANSASNLTG
jgi:hypothetical protein